MILPRVETYNDRDKLKYVEADALVFINSSRSFRRRKDKKYV